MLTVLLLVQVTMFSILNDVIAPATNRLRELPGRLEKDSLREFAQVSIRSIQHGCLSSVSDSARSP